MPFTPFEKGNYENILSNNLVLRRKGTYCMPDRQIWGIKMCLKDRSGVEPEFTIYGQSQAEREQHLLPCLCGRGVHRWGSVTVSTVSFIWTRNARLLNSRENDVPTEWVLLVFNGGVWGTDLPFLLAFMLCYANVIQRLVSQTQSYHGSLAQTVTEWFDSSHVKSQPRCCLLMITFTKVACYYVMIVWFLLLSLHSAELNLC